MADRQVPDRGEGRTQAEASAGRRPQGLAGLLAPALAVLALCALGASPLHGQSDRPPVAELIAALQAKYDSVRNFSAAFEQTYAGGVLRTTLVERGTVLIKKPGKMRWHYTSPEEKLFVSDGVSLYSYIPADRQVIVGSVPPGDSVSTPALFLAGRGNLSRDFVAAYDESLDPPPAPVGRRADPYPPGCRLHAPDAGGRPCQPERGPAAGHRLPERRLGVHVLRARREPGPAGRAVHLRDSPRHRNL